VDLCTDLNLIDYPRGAKLSGAGFWIYRGLGARLEWALLNYFIDTHIGDGYELVLVPHMLGYECGLTAGQFPKFKDDVYWMESAEDERRRFLLPTAETALVSLHRDEILSEADLPRKYISYTPVSAARRAATGRMSAAWCVGISSTRSKWSSIPARRTPTRRLRSWWARRKRWSRASASISAR
jgi:seryl-tRNA synthetase